jgi:DNA-binding transcriptional LysR family regulator
MTVKCDPTRLYRLSVVIEERNLSKAAERLGLTQPALSASIAQLEQEVGVKLLDRGRHGAIPTVFGRALFDHAKIIEAELRRATLAVQELSGAIAGNLAVGSLSGAAMRLVCNAASRVINQRPGININLVEDWSDTPLLDRLRRRELDWVISLPVDAGNSLRLDDRPLFKAKRVFVVREGHPALKAKRSQIATLLDYPIVAPHESNALRRQIEGIFQRMGVPRPRIGATGNGLDLAKQIIKNTDYFGVVTDVSVIDEVEQGLLRKLEIPIPTEFWYRILRLPEISITPTAKFFRDELMVGCKALGLTVDRSYRAGG